MKYRNGEHTKFLIVQGTTHDDQEDQAIAWAERTGSGGNYGYTLNWEVITNPAIIKRELELKITTRMARILNIEEEIRLLKSDSTSLIIPENDN